MAIIKTDKIEIEIQKQTMDKPGSNYFILIKSEKQIIIYLNYLLQIKNP